MSISLRSFCASTPSNRLEKHPIAGSPHHRVFSRTDHRPYPLSARPWIMVQVWHDLLFAHWPVSRDELRRLVPAQLPLDTFEGAAWVGIVPFGITGVRPRGLFPLPGFSTFPELNVRTYVTLDGRPGVFFFSLDAASLLAVVGARAWFHLPYFHAAMSLDVEGGSIRYSSRRKDRGARPAEFRGRYRPTGEVFEAAPGTLDDWLTSRYCLYAVDPRGVVYRGEIHHLPWPLQPAEAEIEVNTMADAAGIRLPARKPLLHFARRLEVLIWSPVKAAPPSSR